MSGSTIAFYGLLHIDRARNLDANLKWAADPIDIYLSCAALAARSAAAQGLRFGLFTNEPSYVQRRLETRGFAPLSIHPLLSDRQVPSVKNFYSAHFKLDAIKALGSGRFGKCVGLVDLDTVFCRPMPAFVSETGASSLAAYDVSVGPHPVCPEENFAPDLELVAGVPLRDPRWYGGEFLIGSDRAMGELAEVVEGCWPRYVANIDTVHHVGDEMVVSAALNVIAETGLPVVDMGCKGVVARWWSQPTPHPQPALDALKGCALLHLPADKKFLARQASQGFTTDAFFEAYAIHLRRKIARKRLLNPLCKDWWPRIRSA